MPPVGVEAGPSSTGNGVLGAVALLRLTPLAPAQVIGADIALGFLVSLIESTVH
jgi:hypothetical protein